MNKMNAEEVLSITFFVFFKEKTYLGQTHILLDLTHTGIGMFELHEILHKLF